MEELGAVGTADLPTLGSLTLFASKGIFGPDSDISGRVELQLSRRVLLRGLWVKFTAINTVNIDGAPSKSDLLSRHEDFYLDGLHDVLIGFGEERDSSNEATYLEILEGSHQWNYHFKVPSDAPFSYCDDVTEVLYNLTVVLDSPLMPMTVSQVSHNIIVGESLQVQTNSNAPVAHKSSTEVLVPLLGLTPIITYAPRPKTYSFSRLLNECRSGFPASLRVETDSRRPAQFDFTFVDTTMPVNCYIDVGSSNSKLFAKPLIVVCRLVSMVSVRESSTKPFLPPIPYPPISPPGATNLNKVLAHGASAKPSFYNRTYPIWNTTCAAQPVLFNEEENGEDMDSTTHKATINVPIRIDPTARFCLGDWPRPSPLPLYNCKENETIMQFTSFGPLFDFKVMLEIAVFKDTKSRPICTPCVCEILITPPQKIPIESPAPATQHHLLSSSSSLSALYRQGVDSDTAAAVLISPVEDDAVVAEPVADYEVDGSGGELVGELIPPRPRNTTAATAATTAAAVSSNAAAAGDLENQSQNDGSSSRPPPPHQYMRPNPYATAIAGGGAGPSSSSSSSGAVAGIATAPAVLAATAGGGAAGGGNSYSGVSRAAGSAGGGSGILPRMDSDILAFSTEVGDVPTGLPPPTIQSQATSSTPHIPRPRIRISTPHATIAITKVRAEVVSRGPAAVLRDRTNAANRIERTPQRHAEATLIGTNAIVMNTGLTPRGPALGDNSSICMSPYTPVIAEEVYVCSPADQSPRRDDGFGDDVAAGGGRAATAADADSAAVPQHYGEDRSDDRRNGQHQQEGEEENAPQEEEGEDEEAVPTLASIYGSSAAPQLRGGADNSVVDDVDGTSIMISGSREDLHTLSRTSSLSSSLRLTTATTTMAHTLNRNASGVGIDIATLLGRSSQVVRRGGGRGRSMSRQGSSDSLGSARAQLVNVFLDDSPVTSQREVVDDDNDAECRGGVAGGGELSFASSYVRRDNHHHSVDYNNSNNNDRSHSSSNGNQESSSSSPAEAPIGLPMRVMDLDFATDLGRPRSRTNSFNSNPSNPNNSNATTAGVGVSTAGGTDFDISNVPMVATLFRSTSRSSLRSNSFQQESSSSPAATVAVAVGETEVVNNGRSFASSSVSVAGSMIMPPTTPPATATADEVDFVGIAFTVSQDGRSVGGAAAAAAAAVMMETTSGGDGSGGGGGRSSDQYHQQQLQQVVSAPSTPPGRTSSSTSSTTTTITQNNNRHSSSRSSGMTYGGGGDRPRSAIVIAATPAAALRPRGQGQGSFLINQPSPGNARGPSSSSSVARVIAFSETTNHEVAEVDAATVAASAATSSNADAAVTSRAVKASSAAVDSSASPDHQSSAANGTSPGAGVSPGGAAPALAAAAVAVAAGESPLTATTTTNSSSPPSNTSAGIGSGASITSCGIAALGLAQYPQRVDRADSLSSLASASLSPAGTAVSVVGSAGRLPPSFSSSPNSPGELHDRIQSLIELLQEEGDDARVVRVSCAASQQQQQQPVNDENVNTINIVAAASASAPSSAFKKGPLLSSSLTSPGGRSIKLDLLQSELNAGRIPPAAILTSAHCDAILASFPTAQEKEAALLAIRTAVAEDFALLSPGGTVDRSSFELNNDRQRVKNRLPAGGEIMAGSVGSVGEVAGSTTTGKRGGGGGGVAARPPSGRSTSSRGSGSGSLLRCSDHNGEADTAEAFASSLASCQVSIHAHILEE